MRRPNLLTTKALLTGFATVTPIAISFIDWEPWQWCVGGLAAVAGIAAIVADWRGNKPFTQVIEADDWNQTEQGSTFLLPKATHGKSHPSATAWGRDSDGSLSKVAAAVNVQPNGTVKIMANGRPSLVVTVD